MNFNWTDNAVTKFLNRLADFCIVNLMWFICCIPIVTFGAATTALYSVMMKIIQNKDGYLCRTFLKEFCNNFRKSTIIWCIVVVLSAISYVDWQILKIIVSEYEVVFGVIAILLLMAILAIAIYAFSLLALYENTIKHTMVNAIILTFVKLPYTLLLLAITIAGILATFYSVKTLMVGIVVWMLIGGALIAALHCLILRQVYKIFEKE